MGGFPDDPGGISCGDDIRRNISRNDTAGSDDGPVSDGNSGTNDGSAPDPDIGPDRDRFRVLQSPPTFLGVEGMHRGVDLHGGADQDIVSDHHLGDIENHAIKIEIDLRAQSDIPAIITMKGRLDPGSGVSPENLAQQASSFLHFGWCAMVEPVTTFPNG